MWVKYFTSSKVVQEYRKKFGEPDVIQVRQTFNDSLQSRDWEHKVIRRMNVVKDNRWLNKHDPKGRFFTEGPHSESTKAKLSAAKLGDKNPFFGKKHSEEHKAKMSVANLGEKHPMYGRTGDKHPLYGKTHSEEHKAKMSVARKGKITALNIETGLITNIPRELYHSRPDIYFNTSSRAFKNWKANQSKK